MKYEKGKTYQFTNKQFNIGRDNKNRLTFILPDSNTGGEYRVLAFNYQNNNIPERITCIFNGSKFEQDPMSAAATLYKPGDVVRFYINSDVRNGKCTLRDEVNDVTYKYVKVGKGPFKRFDRIDCRIEAIGTELQLVPVVEKMRSGNLFTAKDLTDLPEGRYLRYHDLLRRLLDEPRFREPREQLEAGDNRWVTTFLEESLAWVVEMIRQRRLGKDYILPGIESLAIALIERTDYVSKVPEDCQNDVQTRLELVASNAGDYRRVYNLLQCHEADSAMHGILESLKHSSRFYQPQEKVRLLGAMLTLGAVDTNRHMETVLDIVAEHHSNALFMQYFKEGMQQIVARFITDRQEHVAREDRRLLRLLIRALATEQLLAEGSDDRVIARRRGFLYAAATLLVHDDNLCTKAILCYAGLVDCKPEYSWADIRDPQRLCYAYLTRPFAKSDLREAKAVYENEGRLISVTADTLTLAASTDTAGLKRSLTFPLGAGLSAECLTEERVSGFNSDSCKENPLAQRMGFTELRRMFRSGVGTTHTVRRADLRLEQGDHVGIRVTGQLSDSSFECAIVDPVFSGRGVIGERDMVAYDVHPVLDDFRRDGKPLVFDAVVKGVMPDGTYLFTMRPGINALGYNNATYDCDSDAEVACIVTGTYKEGRGYYVLSETCYPMVVWLPADVNYGLDVNDVIVARIGSVNSENDNLFVKGEYLYHVDDNRDGEYSDENIDISIRNIFSQTLRDVATGIYEAGSEAANELSVQQPEENVEMELVDIVGILRFVNRMAYDEKLILGRRYSLVAFCRIMAGLAGLPDFEEHLAIQESLLEEFGQFAATGRLDVARQRTLAEHVKASESPDLYLNNTLALMDILAGLDRPDEFTPGCYNPGTSLAVCSRMVSAYNQLQGLGLDAARREILKGIYDKLLLPQPKAMDVECLKVQEDERNEFKTSLIYPAGSNMHADELKQGREIMEVIDGMLNHKGGTIYLGVNNQGVPQGLDNDFKFLNGNSDKYEIRDIEDKFALHFHYYLRTQIGLTVDGRTVTDYVKLSFDTLGGKMTARVGVEPFPGMVRMKDGRVFQRQDSSTVLLPPQEQSAFAQRRAAL